MNDERVTRYDQPEGVMQVTVMSATGGHIPIVRVTSGGEGLKVGSRQYTVDQCFMYSGGAWRPDTTVYGGDGLRVRGGGRVSVKSPALPKLSAVIDKVLAEFVADRPDWADLSVLLRLHERLRAAHHHVMLAQRERDDIQTEIDKLEARQP